MTAEKSEPTYIMVDVETDGPIPGDYSMISIGAVVVTDPTQSFYGELQPISRRFDPAALRVSGTTREQSMRYPLAIDTMRNFAAWVAKHGGDDPHFVSDNAGFDWMFVCWYFHHFTGSCPFGYSSLSLTSLYKGSEGSLRARLKDVRAAPLSHHPLEDARANADVFLRWMQGTI